MRQRNHEIFLLRKLKKIVSKTTNNLTPSTKPRKLFLRQQNHEAKFLVKKTTKHELKYDNT